MKNINFLILSFIFFVLLSSCGVIKDGFSLQKKDNTDEFLVEKKNPLKLPPDFDELPTPNQDINQQNDDEDGLKELLITSEGNTNNNSESLDLKNNSLEKQLLEKIKQN